MSIKITQLPVSPPVVGTDLFEKVAVSGATTVSQRCSAADLVTFFQTGVIPSLVQILVYVSSKGIALGTSAIPNDGAQFGPDTAGTTTCGIQEAIDSLPQFVLPQAVPAASSWDERCGGGTIILLKGEYVCSGQITIPSDGPFFLKIEGVGKVGTMLKYTGVEDFVINTTPNTLYGFAPLNLIIKDVGFTYVQDTALKALLNLNLNMAHFDGCLFAAFQQLQIGSGVGASLIHLGFTPSHPIGTIGVRMDAANIATFSRCEFDCLAYGLVPKNGGADQLRMRDCIFENINPANSLYPANTLFFNGAGAGSASAGIVFGGSNGDIVDCHFIYTHVPVVNYGSLCLVRPRMELSPGDYTAVTGDGGNMVVEDLYETFVPMDGAINIVTGVITPAPGDGRIITYLRTTSDFRIYAGGVIIFQLSPGGGLVLNVPSTTGLVPPFVTFASAVAPNTAQTMNVWSGKVKVASGQSVYTITNNLVTAAAAIVATVNTTGATSKSCIAVPGAGSFTLNLDAACTADCSVSWTILSP